jgi:predicted permease
MRAEMELHLQRATERLMARGMIEADARFAAKREFGNVGVLQEEARDIRGHRWIEQTIGDVRFAVRHFSRSPLTTATLILVLALGIGGNGAIFSLLQSIVTRPAPGVPDDPSLVRIRGTTIARARGQLRPRTFAMPEIVDLTTRRESFESVGAYTYHQLVLDAGDGNETRSLQAKFVTSNYFSLLRVRPALGPGLPTTSTADTPGAELVAVMAYSLWTSLGADTAMLGRIVKVNDIPVRIVGVAPEHFFGAVRGPSKRASLWLPVEARATVTGGTAAALTSPDSSLFEAFARLTPMTSRDRASATVRVVTASWAKQRADASDSVEFSGDVVPLRGETDISDSGETIGIAAVFSTGGLLILLIACTNISALLIGAAVARRREIAIRLSLGASRARLVRQLVTETTLIALVGGVLGLTLFWWVIRIVEWQIGISAELGPDFGTVAFTTIIALGTGVVFGLSPALHATRADVASALKDAGAGTTTRTRLQRVFIVLQIMLTQPLLVALGLVVAVVIGETDMSRLEAPLAKNITQVEFGGDAASRNIRRAKIAEVIPLIANLPGVIGVMQQAAAFDVGDFRVQPSDRGSGTRAEMIVRAHIEGAPPGYFTFQNIPMLRGRDIEAVDTASRALSLVIDSNFARDFWGGADPIGRRLDITSRNGATEPRTAIVVGVFDAGRIPVRGEGRVYTATGSRWWREAILIRTREPGSTSAPAIRRLLRASMPDLRVDRLATIEQIARQERSDVLSVAAMASSGGLLALLLASIGLYGVVALAVHQRNREIGIRVALGARPGQVTGMFLAGGVKLGALGVLLGLPFSVAALYAITSSFAQDAPASTPLVGVAIAVVVMGVALMATWLPARRAAGVDPLVAMRIE